MARKKKKPQHPLAITQSQVSRALERVDTASDAETRNELTAVFTDVFMALERVRQSRLALDRRPKARNPVVLDGEPTPHREARANEGVSRHPLVPARRASGRAVRASAAPPENTSVMPVRSRVRSPMAMPEELLEKMHATIRELALMGRPIADIQTDIAPKGDGILDAALDRFPAERESLARYVRDALVIERGPAPAAWQRGGDERLRNDEVVRLAHARMAVVRRELPKILIDMLDLFAAQMLGLYEGELPNPRDIGRALAASTDERVGRGGYIGFMLAVGYMLTKVYRDWGAARDQARRIEGVAAEVGGTGERREAPAAAGRQREREAA
jgi:hypothetical protein